MMMSPARRLRVISIINIPIAIKKAMSPIVFFMIFCHDVHEDAAVFPFSENTLKHFSYHAPEIMLPQLLYHSIICAKHI